MQTPEYKNISSLGEGDNNFLQSNLGKMTTLNQENALQNQVWPK